MRNLLLLITLILLAPAAPLLAVDGTWELLGPEGGLVSAVALQPRNPQVMYATVAGGVYKSRDGGASWAWSGEGLFQLSQTLGVAVDAVRPETVYVAQGGGIYRSLDGGGTWRYTGRATAYGVAAHPRFGGRVFAATEYGLYRSADSGTTWTRVTQGLPVSYRVTMIVFDPSSERRLYASAQDPDTNEGGLFRSTDGGVTWRPVHGGPLKDQQVLTLAVDPRSPQTLYAGTYHAAFKSTDGGATWRVAAGLASAGFVWTLKVHPRLSGVVYAGTGAGLFRSQDSGTTWTPVTQGLPAGEPVFAFAFSPASAQTLFVGVSTFFEQGGVFKSVNGGRSWAFSSRGIFGLSIDALAMDPEDPDTLWIVGNSVLFRSTDRGRTWARVRPGPGGARAARVAVNPTDGSNVLVSLSDGTLRRTRDGGRTWESAGNPNVAPFGNAKIVFDPRTPSTVYAAGLGIAKSTDGGTSWTPLSGEPSDMVFIDLEISPSDSSTLYGSGGGGSAGARVVRSTDRGATWTRMSQQGLPPSPSDLILDLAIDPLVATTVYAVPNVSEKVYKTADGGGSWSVFSDEDIFPERSVGPLGISAFPAGLLYLAVGTDRVEEMTADGSREPLGTSPRKGVYTRLVVDPHDPCRIYAGTANWGLMVFTKRGTAECN